MHLYFCHLELFPLKLANWKLVLKDIGHSYFPVKDCDKHWRCFYRKNRIIRWSHILLSSFSRNSWIELWKCSLHIVYILKIKMAWSLTKLWHSDQRFIKNILTPLLLKICLKYVRMCILQLLINNTCYLQVSGYGSIVDTHKYMGLSIMSWMCLHDFFLQTLSGVQFLTWNVILYTCDALI